MFIGVKEMLWNAVQKWKVGVEDKGLRVNMRNVTKYIRCHDECVVWVSGTGCHVRS